MIILPLYWNKTSKAVKRTYDGLKELEWLNYNRSTWNMIKKYNQLLSISNLQWCEFVTVIHNYIQVTNMYFFKKDFLFKLRPHVIELQLKLLLNNILKVRGGIKIENRENLGQCPNRGRGLKKKQKCPNFNLGILEIQKCPNLVRGVGSKSFPSWTL